MVINKRLKRNLRHAFKKVFQLGALSCLAQGAKITPKLYPLLVDTVTKRKSNGELLHTKFESAIKPYLMAYEFEEGKVTYQQFSNYCMELTQKSNPPSQIMGI